MSSDSPFSADLIKQTTEAVGNFLRWVAELIVARNWFSLLVLVAIAGVFLFNPGSGLAFKFLDIKPPEGYARGFWLGEVGLFFVALAIAVRTMPRAVPASQADTADRQAIKGLRPFEATDAEVFSQLQRQQDLGECLESLTSQSFRFGILHGESGCGKTSFLQAGISSHLTLVGTCPVGIYVRFSDQEPIRTIARALAEQLEIPLSWLLPEANEQIDFLRLLGKVSENSDQTLILLLDQFEQFFVHCPRREQRQPFIQALKGWYCSDNPLPVKILVAIRSDLMYHLHEMQQALGYSLAPQDVFRLDKFTPTEASRILEVIARTEGLTFNRDFVTELARAELANCEDGRISPVDLQILAWMIERQTADELRAFNRSAFEKFGGVEGLLQRFLERSLEARVTDSQRQSVVKVLLALTDMERQVRAGMLTAPELKEKLKGSARPEEVAEAITWLVRGDVRLITPQGKNGEVAYELAHERLIPALMRQASKELSAVDQANQLLNRRVNEWLGNRCDRRYCFGLRELLLLRQQGSYLVWGAKREQKEKLLRLSQRRVYGGVAALLIAVIISSGFAGWWNLTPSGQIQKMQWQLSGLLKKNSSADIGAEAAVAFAKNDQWNRAIDIKGKSTGAFIQESAGFLGRATFTESKTELLAKLKTRADEIEDDYYKSDALSAIASAYGDLNDPAQAKALLSEALTAANTIDDDYAKSSALSEIASAYSDVNDPAQAKAVLSEALTAANTIESDSSKSYALRVIASAAGDLNDPAQAKAVLSEALTSANTIESDSYKSDALRAIVNAGVAVTDSAVSKTFLGEVLQGARRGKTSVPMVEIATYYAKQADWFQVLHALSQAETREKTIGLSRALIMLAEHKQPALIRGAVVLPAAANGIDYSGQPNNYTLKVQIQSPDTSCDQRADWWEVITPDGQLLARKSIGTLHQDEQPFSDALSPVSITPDQTVLIRAHFRGDYFSGADLLVDERMGGYYSKSGYTDQALKGSIAEGFKVVRISENFAHWLEKKDPLPDADACQR